MSCGPAKPFKTVLLFGGMNNEPRGGMFDLIGMFDTSDKAEEHANEINLHWWHICHPGTGHWGGPNPKTLQIQLEDRKSS